jgi:sigma-B regulation protein RsbU (phosphoserine phosphatase)
MERGELVCIVTDGVVDARNPEGERYGSERLQAVLARSSPGETTARALVDAIVADVRMFVRDAEPADDLTVLALRWNGRK